MRNIEDYISPFVESQFPEFYREEGPDFIAFTQAYYEWMESTGQTINYSRNMLEYRDVDKTIDSFIVHFKEKYLKNIPFEVVSDKRLLIKHIHDLYRTKGTERGVELLFRLIYDVAATVYYPGDDVFKLSSGEWKVPEYIEVSPSSDNIRFIGETVLGTTSGAYAYVERVVRKRVQGKFIDVLFIDSRVGNFAYNERIVAQSDPKVEGAPKVIGSMTDLIVTNGGQDFQVGDVLDVMTGSGQQGRALVTSISTETGRVNFTIQDGGFGYTSNAQVIISNTNLTFTNATNSNTEITGFERFETVKQPLGTINFTTASNAAQWSNGSIIENYYANGSVSANAIILLSTPTSALSGTLIYSPISGNVASDATISVRGNTHTATITSYTDSTATGNVMFTSNTVVGVHSTNNVFISYPGNYFYGLTTNTYATISNKSTGYGATFKVGGLTNEEQVLVFSDLIRAKNTGNVSFTSIKLDGSNSNVAANGYGFVKYPGGSLTTTLQNVLRYGNKTIGEITVISGINPGEGYNADPYVVVIEPEVSSLGKRDVSLKLSNITGLFVPGETIEMSSNSVGQQINVTGFTGTAANGAVMSTAEVGEYVYQSNGTANVATGFVNQVSIAGGSGTIKLSETVGTFVNTYQIHTLTTNAIANVTTSNTVTIVTETTGQVKSGNSSYVSVKRTSLNNDFAVGSTVLGKLSGAVATITDVADDEHVLPIGENAIVEANVQVANTVVSSLKVMDSGFGYVDSETVTLSSANTDYIVTAKAVLNQQGVSEGYYKSEKGFLDGAAKVHDGDYYQDYSYEVQTRIPFNKYAEVLKNVMHTAGTTFFGKVVFDSVPTIAYNGTEIVDERRTAVLSIFDGQGTYTTGSRVTQGSSSAIVVKHDASYAIANAAPYLEFNQQASTPNLSSNSSSCIIKGMSSNATHTVVYADGNEGTVDSGDTIEAIIGRTITVNNVQQGNSVTGSFANGEVVYQSNAMNGTHTANGTVFSANSTTVEIRMVDGTWNANALIYGVTSNAYANVFNLVNTTNTFSVITALNNLHIANIEGSFVKSTAVVDVTTSATANVGYVTINLDT